MNDMKNHMDLANSLTPAARTASANGSGVDLQGFHGALAVVICGTRTDGTHTPSLEESDDNSTFTAVAAADMEGTFAAIATGVNQRVGYKGRARYIRLVTTVSGATTGAVYGMGVVRGFAHREPVA